MKLPLWLRTNARLRRDFRLATLTLKGFRDEFLDLNRERADLQRKLDALTATPEATVLPFPKRDAHGRFVKASQPIWGYDGNPNRNDNTPHPKTTPSAVDTDRPAAAGVTTGGASEVESAAPPVAPFPVWITHSPLAHPQDAVLTEEDDDRDWGGDGA